MNYSNFIYFQGELCEKGSISEELLSPGFLLNIGVFETIRSYNGVPFRLDHHLDRLVSGLDHLGLNKNLSKDSMTAMVHDLIRTNETPNAYIRITCFKTAGGTTDMIATAPYEGYDEALYQKGMKLYVSSFRKNENSGISRYKTSSMLENQLAHDEARLFGADTALMLNSKGNICDAAWANFFSVKNGILSTPRIEDGALPGITRHVVLSLAQKMGIQSAESRLSLEDVKYSDEIFLTNSLMEIMPVSSLSLENVAYIGESATVTTALRAAFAQEITSSV